MSEFLSELVPAIGVALLHSTWQCAAIGAVAAIALRTARDARPQARYAIACVALLGCVLAPLVTVVLQYGGTSPVSLMEGGGDAMRIVGDVAGVASSDWHARFAPWQPSIVAMWAAGASVFCLRTLFGVAWVRRMHATKQPPLQARWQGTLDALAARFELHGVALRLVDGLDSPVAAGWWRPVVLLPMSVALRMPADLVEALLAHELAHVRRHDYLVNLLQRAAEALLFHHPVAWWLSHRIRIERELVADRLAADVLGEPRRLAVALAALSELPTPARPLPHVAHAAHGGHLMSRIQQLVRPQSRSPLPVGRIALPMIGVAAACIAFIAQAQIGKNDPVIASHVSPVVASVAAQVQSMVRDTDLEIGDGKAWAIVRKGVDGYSMSGTTSDMDGIAVAKRSLQNDFIWFKRDHKAYVIDDPATVARAEAAWKDTDIMGERMSALGAKMEVHGKKMEAYGKKMEALVGGDHGPSPEMTRAQESMSAMAGQQQELAGRQMLLASKMHKVDDEKEREKIEVDMEKLNADMESIGEEMEKAGEILERETARYQANQPQMEALGKQMEEASKPMEELGAQMEVLGKQQESLVRKAEKELEVIIADAQKKGLVRPAPKAQ